MTPTIMPTSCDEAPLDGNPHVLGVQIYGNSDRLPQPRHDHKCFDVEAVTLSGPSEGIRFVVRVCSAHPLPQPSS